MKVLSLIILDALPGTFLGIATGLVSDNGIAGLLVTCGTYFSLLFIDRSLNMND